MLIKNLYLRIHRRRITGFGKRSWPTRSAIGAASPNSQCTVDPSTSLKYVSALRKATPGFLTCGSSPPIIRGMQRVYTPGQFTLDPTAFEIRFEEGRAVCGVPVSIIHALFKYKSDSLGDLCVLFLQWEWSRPQQLESATHEIRFLLKGTRRTPTDIPSPTEYFQPWSPVQATACYALPAIRCSPLLRTPTFHVEEVSVLGSPVQTTTVTSEAVSSQGLHGGPSKAGTNIKAMPEEGSVCVAVKVHRTLKHGSKRQTTAAWCLTFYRLFIWGAHEIRLLSNTIRQNRRRMQRATQITNVYSWI